MTNKIREDIVENQLAGQESYQYLSPELKNKIEWFKNQKIGVIFHWGLYSQAGIVESWQLSEEDNWARKKGAWRSDLKTLRKDYWNLNKVFNPINFNPDEWAKKSKLAGFRYMLFTAKHHDGFNMYDTNYSEYKITSPNSKFSENKKSDIFKGIVEAFRKQNISVGAYYSKPDWHSYNYWEKDSFPKGRYASYDPKEKPEKWDAFNNYVTNQLVEICNNYGPIDILWLDGGWVNSQNNELLNMPDIAKKVRKINPKTLIVDRTIGGEFENYVTPERKVPNVVPKKAWESNIPIAKNWGYVPNDVFKPFNEILDSLVRVITLGGNVILGMGPKPDGNLPLEAENIMQKLGEWLNIFGEAVYNSRPDSHRKYNGLNLTVVQNKCYSFYHSDMVGNKVDLNKLSLMNHEVSLLENKKLLDIKNGFLVLPPTSFDYSVIKFKK